MAMHVQNSAMVSGVSFRAYIPFISFVGEDDLLDISDYLIELNKIDIYNLGLVLGLSKHRVDGLMDSKTFCDDVITAWLQKVDQVKTRGAPTWQRMVEALRHQRVRQNDIADKIKKDKIL